MILRLSPTTQKLNTKELYGFDVETYDRNRKFCLGSIVGKDYRRLFHDKDALISELMTKRFQHSILCATNLSFDFLVLFFGSTQIKNFDMLFRGSDMLMCKTHVYNNRFNRHYNKHRTSLTFLDTMNYSKASVKKLGDMLEIPKLEKPKALGRRPRNKAELKELSIYNIRDSEISYKAIRFFFSVFEELGATPKMTIASTAMSLYKNRYLHTEYFRHDKEVLLKIFEGYYGGRTEAFSRGKIENINYYDVNSLYPDVMRLRYPNPNSLHMNRMNTDYYIMNYEGMSEVSISCPYMDYPLLPLRHEDKLIFPTGTFRGSYCNNELRRAIQLGYTVLKVHNNIYYTSVCEPFRHYVEDLYSVRMRYKELGSPMEKVVKLFLNGLYGKFGQKFEGKENLLPFNHTAEELDKLQYFEILGDFIRIKTDTIPASFCIPIWAAYVTAYGRMKLHDLILLAKPFYVDTDSLMTTKYFKESKELGELKLEMRILDGIIVKPKFYFVRGEEGTFSKIKGVSKRLVADEFHRLMIEKKISYSKFLKIKESLRRKDDKIPNEIVPIMKRLSMEDTKRGWSEPFNHLCMQHSQPINILGGNYEEIEEPYEGQERAREAEEPIIR